MQVDDAGPAKGTDQPAVQNAAVIADADIADTRVKTSLLAATAKARRGAPKESEDDKRLKEEQEMLHNITNRTALRGVKELAKVSQHLTSTPLHVSGTSTCSGRCAGFVHAACICQSPQRVLFQCGVQLPASS